jgi:CHAT domain-containing protein/tetratricopeptide (TPR) repeat protein
MNFRNHFLGFVLICTYFFTECYHPSLILGNSAETNNAFKNVSVIYQPDPTKNTSDDVSQIIELLKISFQRSLLCGDTTQTGSLVKQLKQRLAGRNISESLLSESYFLIGAYHIFIKSYREAITYINSCISIKIKNGEIDERYAKALYNLGIAYFYLGDFRKHEEYSAKSLEIEKKLNGESSPLLFNIYFSLSSAYQELQEYEKALNYSSLALAIANNHPDSISHEAMAGLYESLGVCYTRLADFSKAKIYLDKAESFYKLYNLRITDNYINLMNSSAFTYGALNLTAESGEYYKKVIPLALANNSPNAYNIINSYSIFLADHGRKEEGEKLLKDALERAKARSKISPRDYFLVLINYGSYLRDYSIDNARALRCFEECIEYLKMNEHDLALKTSVTIGYSLTLNEDGQHEKALNIIQSMLSGDLTSETKEVNYSNPGIDKLKLDRTSLKILNTKYKILWDIYKKTGEKEILEAASNTSELIVALLEKVRINISEDDSRIILGDTYRSSYLSAIYDFNLLYKNSDDPKYLEKAFEYSEKSKVAGLLTSTRELKATQLNIPSDIAEFEKKLQVDISLYNARIAEETAKEKANSLFIDKWKENLLDATRSRDSLILVFEKLYPVYYAVKYDTRVAHFDDIPTIMGRNGNYVNYVLSDTLLYTFVANRKHQTLLVTRVDSSFFNDIRKFRGLLTMPKPSDNASIKFKEYTTIGYRLYKTLIDPIKASFISDKLIISPDDILSYLPFEAILSSDDSVSSIDYKRLSYLMNSYDISYTYSATFLAESFRKENRGGNKLIAFAPDYPEQIDVKSVLMSRQAGLGVLHDLPYARLEAKYVTDITGGKLYANSEARESVYKSESGKYDIIHLAMHTLLNENDPMLSTLIFSKLNDSTQDGYLKMYEIYGIPLRAKMVVLSSCNTGTGVLFSGEGILSLARGFIFSGSQSVVMSMWEIEDKSGTEVVEMFYKNLMKGYTKSVALKKARTSFLENSDRLRSHPYFWSTLVVYGNNASLYHSYKLKIGIAIVAFLALGLVIYSWKRRDS